jgi:hypothetical protein
MIQIFHQLVEYLLVNPIVTKHGYRVYNLHKHKLLKAILEQYSFFDFYTTNNGHMVGEHQIVSFFYWGYNALMNGFKAPKDEINVHHKDSNPSNNNPYNLVYLSTQDHLLVSALANSKILTKDFVKGNTPFNRQGRSIKNITAFLVNVARDTMRHSINKVGKHSAVGRHLRHTFLRAEGLVIQLGARIHQYIRICKDMWLPEFKESPQFIKLTQ